MTDEIEFLRDLQQKLRHENNGQASPRLWVVGSRKWGYCPAYCGEEDLLILSCEDSGFIMSGESEECSLEEYLIAKYVHYQEKDMSKEVYAELEEALSSEWYDKIIDWCNQYVTQERAKIIPVERIAYNEPNTFFLTKEECEKYIEKNCHKLGSEPRACTMTSPRATQVEDLWEILNNFNWEKVLELLGKREEVEKQEDEVMSELQNLKQQVAELQAKVSTLVTPSPTPNFDAEHEVYTDSNDTEWVTLIPATSEIGGLGNALIISEHTLLQNAEYHFEKKFVDFNKSALFDTIDDWFANNLAEEIRDVAIKSKYDKHEIFPDKDGEITAFPLSVTEVDKYLSGTEYLQSDGWWWLRSVGAGTEGSVRIVSTTGNFGTNLANDIGTSVRPAIWVSVKD